MHVYSASDFLCLFGFAHFSGLNAVTMYLVAFLRGSVDPLGMNVRPSSLFDYDQNRTSYSFRTSTRLGNGRCRGPKDPHDLQLLLLREIHSDRTNHVR